MASPDNTVLLQGSWQFGETTTIFFFFLIHLYYLLELLFYLNIAMPHFDIYKFSIEQR